ncbi:MAG TPA: FxSxx-COOH system tetratricopeptide repeat protein [Actinophytocola sp.]|uniref:FxSxx-COOH system tetratricopeptide repeat protein n=1 Tax=Actinophytocola sp. TaxID=1872138 RepID=UPI002DDC9E3B|nr:FxSxx-COOH system tetratricopeptide repeat protein [Actinophytocola sp.]HEV2778996.1 FxSxx-COOH system tetratricopeptide repeat protein [Actinophytocola sp.]
MAREAEPRESVAPRRGLSIRDKTRLMDAVNAVPILADTYRRQRVLEQLHDEYGSAFDPKELGSDDNWTIVDACIQLGAMPELVNVLKFVGDESPQWRRLEQLVRELFPPSPEPVTRELDERVHSLLAPIPDDITAAVLHHDAFRSHTTLTPADPGSAIDVYHRLRTQPDTFPLLSFLEVIGHHLEGYTVVELHRLIDDLALRSGLTARVRELCQELRAAPQRTPDQPIDEQGEGPETDDDDIAGGDVRSPVARLDPFTRVQRVPPKVWGGVPPRNSHFTGREDVLDHLHHALRQHAQSALVPQPLHGLGGIGKSQVAVEFAYRHQFDYELVWWIQADDEPSIRRSLVSLARRLGQAESEDVDETVDRVLDALRLGNPHENWLLIYDNAPEPATVQRYLPSGPGHVLVTSRSRSWAGLPNAMEIDVFTPEESVALLRERWSGLTDESALALAEQLGHLPLALEQAVAVHEQTGMPLADYLRALASSPRIILDEGTPTNYPRTVAAALGLAYDSIKAASPAAAYLLQLCAFISSHPIAIPMLIRGRHAQPVAELRDDLLLRRAVRDLGRNALVQLDVSRDFIRVHSLIRAVLRDSIPPEERAAVQQTAHAVLATANPGEPDDPSTWTQHAQIAPHVVPAGMILSLDPDVRRVVLDQIRYHWAIGDYTTSRDLGRATVDSWRASCGPDDELTLLAARQLGISTRMLGRYREARDLIQDTLDRMIRTLGPDHEHSLATANTLAADFRLAGELREAFRLDEHNLERHRAVLGERDPATLRALSNLAVDFRILGDSRKAAELDEQNIELRKDIYGADHPKTLFSYNMLIRDLYALGQYQRGLALAREKMPIYEQKLPPNHRDLLLAKRNLAILLRMAGHYLEALEQSKALYDSCRRKFGDHHEHTLSAMVTLSNAHRVTGDIATALQYGQNALTGYREVLGETHVFTLGCQINVAIVLRLLDRRRDANALNDQALTGLVASLGEDHPFTLCAANTKANGLAAEGRVEDAKALGEQTLARSRRVRGEHHPSTLACAANLAFDLEKLGDLVEANRLRRQTLDQLGVQLGLDHPETTNAGVYRRMESDVEVPPT